MHIHTYIHTSVAILAPTSLPDDGFYILHICPCCSCGRAGRGHGHSESDGPGRWSFPYNRYMSSAFQQYIISCDKTISCDNTNSCEDVRC